MANETPPEPRAIVAPELIDDSYFPLGYGPTRAQVRWFQSLRGYLTLHLDRRDLVPPEVYRLTEEDKALPPIRRDGYDRWHARWMDRMLMRVLEGEDANIVFKLDKYFPGANTEQRDQNMALEVARLLADPYALDRPEPSRARWAIDKVADEFDLDEKLVRTARQTWKVTPEILARWTRTLHDAGKFEP
jgi:hypothetical protein